jgi:hypothetical protein
MEGPEFAQLIAEARAKIREGDLPEDIHVSSAQCSDSKHQDFCRVCGEVIRTGELVWYQLDWYSTGRPDPHMLGPKKPELHLMCHMAWSIAAKELEDAARGGRV